MALLTYIGAVVPSRAQGAAGGMRGVVYDAEFDGPVHAVVAGEAIDLGR
jgi:hypothetical protein